MDIKINSATNFKSGMNAQILRMEKNIIPRHVENYFCNLPTKDWRSFYNIDFKDVLVIDENGTQLGVMSRDAAIEKAEELCDVGTVELDSMDFVGREVRVRDKEDYLYAEKLQRFKLEE